MKYYLNPSLWNGNLLTAVGFNKTFIGFFTSLEIILQYCYPFIKHKNKAPARDFIYSFCSKLELLVKKLLKNKQKMKRKGSTRRKANINLTTKAMRFSFFLAFFVALFSSIRHDKKAKEKLTTKEKDATKNYIEV